MNNFRIFGKDGFYPSPSVYIDGRRVAKYYYPTIIDSSDWDQAREIAVWATQTSLRRLGIKYQIWMYQKNSGEARCIYETIYFRAEKFPSALIIEEGRIRIRFVSYTKRDEIIEIPTGSN